jgi:hypothetical protein
MDLKIQPISLAEQPEQLIKTDANTITRYKVIEERIDIGDLVIEKKGIEEQLANVMSDEELLKWAKANHPQPDVSGLQARLDEIQNLLEVK